jgi:hypothetical protein
MIDQSHCVIMHELTRERVVTPLPSGNVLDVFG